MLGPWISTKIYANRGEITLWAVVGCAILVIAYVTNPQWFSGFFDWFWGAFLGDLKEMDRGGKPRSKLNITNQ
jgi:hypothetical protein